MSSKTRVPRLSAQETPALRLMRGNPARIGALFFVPAAASLMVALLAEGPLFKASMAAVGLALVLFVFYIWALADASQQGVVRVISGGGLRFVPRRAVLLLPLSISLAGLTPGLLALLAPSLTEESFGRGQGAVWWVLMSGASLLWLVQMTWSLRVPTGLAVSAWGLVGARGAAAVRLPWPEIASASAIRTGTIVKLSVQLRGGSSLAIDTPNIGSDPNVVAAIIEFYRANPDQRTELENVDRALRAVEAS